MLDVSSWERLGQLTLAARKDRMDLRPYIRGTLWAGGLLLIALAVSAALWLILGTAGDVGGSQGAKGVMLVALVGLVLDVLALNVFLAIAELTRSSGYVPTQESTAKPDQPDGGHGSSVA